MQEDKIIATGTTNSNGLLEFDTSKDNSNTKQINPKTVANAAKNSDDEWLTLHKKFAHANVQTIKRTLIQLDLPIPKHQMPSKLFCNTCFTTKTN